MKSCRFVSSCAIVGATLFENRNQGAFRSFDILAIAKNENTTAIFIAYLFSNGKKSVRNTIEKKINDTSAYERK